VVKEAPALKTASVILAHNHPFGGIQTRKEDLELTRTLTAILKVIDVRVLDHLIAGEEILSLTETGHHSA